jgi:3-oxoacyl-[acyl-carrier protein] reductase
VIQTALDSFGRIHSVITSQGRPFSAGPVATIAMDDFRAQLETDLFGFLNVVQASIPHLRRGGGGSITAILAAAVRRNVVNNGLAIAPKVAVASMVQSIAAEEGQFGIRVNAVGPGATNAGLAVKLSKGATGEVIGRATGASVLGRVGEAGEIAELAVFLASAKAGFTTGQLVISDGGFSI